MSNIEQLRREGQAARLVWDFGRDELPLPAPAFEVGGVTYTLADMLAANASDEDFCRWARDARPGDLYPAVAPVHCVSGLAAATAAFTLRCPQCRIPMGNDGRYLCVACSGGEAARYEP